MRRPGTYDPLAVEPEVVEPDAAEPEVVEPEVVELEAAEPAPAAPPRKRTSENSDRVYTPAEDNISDPKAPPFDPTELDFSSPEDVKTSLQKVARAVAARSLSPAMGKSIAAISTTALGAIKYSVTKQLREMQDHFKAQEAELRGAGRRRGI